MAQGTTIKHKKKTKSVLKNIRQSAAPGGDQSHESDAGADVYTADAGGFDGGRYCYVGEAGFGDFFGFGQGDPEEDFDGEYGKPV